MSTLPKRVHLVGIGGAHMSAIAKILMSRGHSVSGSDLRASEVTESLTSMGAQVKVGPHSAENIGDAELVVTTSAAIGENAELDEAVRRGLRVIKRAEMVARLMDDKIGVAIAGCHDKSTTSGLVAYILASAGRDPTYLIGAQVTDLGTNAAAGTGDVVVVEADEYDRAFLSYSPDVALVTNVEEDHLDYYKTWDAVKEAFQQFASQVRPGGRLLLCADNAEARLLREHTPQGVEVATYGLEEANAPDWLATGLVNDAGGQTFNVSYKGEAVGQFFTPLAGRHMVQNAVGSIAVCFNLDLTAVEIRPGLAQYLGVGRRFEPVGEAAGVTVMDDYAHHPTEIEALAGAARARFRDRRLVVLFQPHTYARSRYLLDESPDGSRAGFKQCFRGFDKLFILETYAAREAIADGMTGEQLARELSEPEAGYAATFEDAAHQLAAMLEPGDVMFTVGAGDVDTVGPMVLERLREKGRA